MNTTVNETGLGILGEAFKKALNDLVAFLPNILIALAIILIYVLIAIILTRITRILLSFFKIDELIKPFFKSSFSITNIIIILIDIGIALLALYTTASLLFPTQLGLITSIIEYSLKVASIVFLIVFLFVTLEALIDRIRMEAKMRGFMFLLLFFISLVLIIDITALSPEVKHSLAIGISIGIGLTIGVFATWYFFREYIEKKTRE